MQKPPSWDDREFAAEHYPADVEVFSWLMELPMHGLSKFLYALMHSMALLEAEDGEPLSVSLPISAIADLLGVRPSMAEARIRELVWRRLLFPMREGSSIRYVLYAAPDGAEDMAPVKRRNG